MKAADRVQLKAGMHRWSMRDLLVRGVWVCVWAIVGRGPKFLSGFRCVVLRLFGAEIGRDVLISGRVRVLMPWNLKLGDRVAIGAGVDFYNFCTISVGSDSVVSQRAWLCTGSHDYESYGFELTWKPVVVGSNVWVAAESFLGPGTVIEDWVVVGARSVCFGLLKKSGVYAGNPIKFLKLRNMDGRRKYD